MAIEKRKLSEVTLAETTADNANVLIEEDGAIKKVSLDNIVTKIADSNKGVDPQPILGRSATEFVDDNVENIAGYAFDHYIGLEKVALGNVKNIGSYAFSWCQNLSEVTLPDTLEAIGAGAFYYCWALSNISIPNNLKALGDDAFYGCPLEYTEYENVRYLGNNDNPYLILREIIDSNVESLTIHEGTKFIDCYLGWRSPIQNISIPDSIVGITRNTNFSDCTSLQYTEYNNGKYLGNSDNPHLVLCGVVDTSVTSFEIPDSVKIISNGAFSGCSSLTSIDIPTNVTCISQSAFSDCSALTSITIPDNVSSLGSWVFPDSLTSVTIGKGVKMINNGAFGSLSETTEINFGGTVAEWRVFDVEGLAYSKLTVHCADGDALTSMMSGD